MLSGCAKQEVATRKWQYTTLTIENYLRSSASFKAAADDPKPKAFDYKDSAMGSFSEDKDMQKMGDEGWELVAAIPQTETTFPDSPNRQVVRTGAIVLFFKRPL